MDTQELRQLRRSLDRFVKRFESCIKMRASQRHLRTYLKGQLGPLERKSVEPMALDARVPPRTLQEFLSIHRWDEDRVSRKIRKVVQRDHGHEEAIGVVDETSFPKCGDKTVGVQRQYCGALGKTDNCVMTVHLGFVSGDFHALIDGDLYLPESWSNDRERCREAGVPEEVAYRPRWQIAMDLITRSLEDGVGLRWITADEAYGRVPAFRDGVAQRDLLYVVEVDPNLQGWTQKPEMEPPGRYSPQGLPRRRPRLAQGARRARPVSGLWKRGGPPWQLFQVKESQKGPVIWRVRETMLYTNRDRVPTATERLLVAEQVLTGEVKYFLTNAPVEIPLRKILTVAFSRWHIEKLFKEAKGEVGMDHFEVRRYLALKRHLVLTNLSILFLAHETDRLRGEKPRVDDLPGADGGGSTAASWDVPVGTVEEIGGSGEEDRILASLGA